jgi:hypothetical protein
MNEIEEYNMIKKEFLMWGLNTYFDGQRSALPVHQAVFLNPESVLNIFH